MNSNLRIISHDFQVGDEVSYGFNGDFYPCGDVEKITNNFITCSGGRKFRRKLIKWHSLIKNTEWKIVDSEECLKECFYLVGGGNWVLVKGIINKRNPHF